MGAHSRADEVASTWTCELQTTKVSGYSVAYGPETSVARGIGNVHCATPDGGLQRDTNVQIEVLGAGVGLGYTHIRSLNVKAYGAGLATANDLFGRLKLQGSVQLMTFSKGTELATYTALNQAGASVGVELSGLRGNGLEASSEVSSIIIIPYRSRYEPKAL